MNSWEEKIKNSSSISVPLAEFEFLAGEQGGQIDPNVLSAGGFPVMILSTILDLLEEEKKEEQNKSDTENTEIFFQEMYRFLRDRLKVSEQEAEHGSGEALRILENIFGVQIFSQLELLRRSLNVFEEEEIIENSLEEWKRYFHDVYGLTYLDKRWWINYRMFLVERFFECLHQGRPIGPFTIDIMRTVDDFLECYMDSFGLYQNSEQQRINSYKVFWESDLGHFLHYKLSKHNNKEIEVRSDIFINSGLYSPLPWHSLVFPLSATKKKKAQKMLKGLQKRRKEEGFEIIGKKEYPFIGYTDSDHQAKLYFRDGTIFVLKETFPPEEPSGSLYNPCGYMFEHLGRKVEMDNLSDRLALFSNVFNAKAATFTIYKDCENNNGKERILPPTVISPDSYIPPSDWEKAGIQGKLVIKEGGGMSTGGKEVIFQEHPPVESMKDPFFTSVIQSRIPSVLFTYQGKPSHGHARKVSVLDSQGNVCHLGYIIKLNADETENSSKFISVMLFYSEEKKFIVGKKIEGDDQEKKRYFFDPEEVDLRPYLDKNSFDRFLSACKENWLFSIYTLNDFCSRDPGRDILEMVEQGMVKDIYKGIKIS